MDVYEATKIVLSKIQTLDPENASKIMGLLLIQDHGEKEMIRLAFGPETLIHSIVLKARQQLSISKNPDLFYRTWPETHQRSFSVGESDDLSGFGWKPCLYYARGYCKNGTSCRFLHGDIIGDSAGAGDPFPQSPSSLANFILHQQQEDSPRGEEMNIFGRNRGFDLAAINGGSRIMNPVSRQIYLTFPAESSFREEDVSIYFSIYGPVQDVRIPYQQKRMFGFVTFLYPETVKLILAKGNPHFVCDSRVLVKPYKEKGKINLDKLRSPTGFDSRDPFDIPIGPRMFSNSQELLWRRKLEEEEAIEIQAKRLMGFHFLDVKSQNHHRTVSAGAGAGAGLSSPTSHFCSPRVSFYSDQLNQKVNQSK
ncbi:zinc finger CCCH domain-containing protein 23 [Impatiens glandulifera]|uniref:zinc finger CCCH domain-containing protein 23 n=1 Tax=Impatiens glandulifera TaxID=253017 RepID=UPI001FB0F3A1|nr:zinc finger CCCH domain-containing protein 23 [Impatiens glandulifera]